MLNSLVSCGQWSARAVGWRGTLGVVRGAWRRAAEAAGGGVARGSPCSRSFCWCPCRPRRRVSRRSWRRNCARAEHACARPHRAASPAPTTAGLLELGGKDRLDVVERGEVLDVGVGAVA
eukprot:1803837-Prymnesium_polylepis.1